MPKRPCALAITHDNEFILCGDKFGDVYALPLLGTDRALATGTAQTSNFGTEGAAAGGGFKADERVIDVHPTTFKPSASILTVHSGRNLRALKEQQLRAQQSLPAKPKPIKNFEHEIILGHVSMLTDITTCQVDSDESGKSLPAPRNYILTSDRDEHIRISRGRPQAHIIETFCFGHTQFVSKMCLAWPDVLVSGGGDDDLFIWDWRRGHLLGKIDIRGPLRRYFGLAANARIKSRAVNGATHHDGKQFLGKGSQSAAVDTQGNDVLHGGPKPTQTAVEDAALAVSGIYARREPESQDTSKLVFTSSAPGIHSSDS